MSYALYRLGRGFPHPDPLIWRDVVGPKNVLLVDLYSVVRDFYDEMHWEEFSISGWIGQKAYSSPRTCKPFSKNFFFSSYFLNI
jgi:hypothetical protein